jgi:hypothetical protein
MIPRYIFYFLLLMGGILPSLHSSSVEELAEFLAGISLPKKSSLAPFQQTANYREHQKALHDQWAFCRKLRYNAMQQWGRDHLGNDLSQCGIVRYLFGGPDFLNVSAFFPEARMMVLGGLEPIGELPEPETLDTARIAVGLKDLREVLRTSLFCGYFITSEMKPQLLQGSFHGVLPVLLTELALTENRILSVEMVKPFGSPGIKILYAHYDPRADSQPQTLYYFQADLSNGMECKRFLGWLGDLGEGASYLKAASYLLPLDAFSQTRDFLLKSSTLILQDDSGIPFHDFPVDQWKIQLFGVYTDPLPIFQLHKEPELAAAYTSPSTYAGELPFGVGYHVNAPEANLLLARRLHLPWDGVAPSSVMPPEALPTPEPTPTPIRKALPVEVRKALPVDAP